MYKILFDQNVLPGYQKYYLEFNSLKERLDLAKHLHEEAISRFQYCAENMDWLTYFSENGEIGLLLSTAGEPLVFYEKKIDQNEYERILREKKPARITLLINSNANMEFRYEFPYYQFADRELKITEIDPVNFAADDVFEQVGKFYEEVAKWEAAKKVKPKR